MKHYLILWFVIVPGFESLAQNSKVDSLWSAYRKETNDSLRWAALLRLEVAYSAVNHDSAMLLCHAAAEIAHKRDDNLMLFYTYNELGNCYLDILNYDEALDNFRKAIEKGKADPRVEIASPLGNIALIYKAKGDLAQASKYTQEALNRYLEIDDNEGVVRQYINLGTYELKADRFNAARNYFERAANRARGKDEYLEAMALNNIGAVLLKQKNYRDAAPFFRQALTLYNNQGAASEKIVTLINLGVIAQSEKNWPQAESYFLAALADATRVNSPDDRADALERLAEISAATGLFNKAYQYETAFHALKDSINSSLYSTRLADLESRYRLKEQETRLSNTELELTRQKQMRNIALGGLILLLLVSAAVAYVVRQRNRFRKKSMEMAIRLEKAEAQKLRELDSLKSAFFANISHEFRTPLTLLISPLRELARGQLRGDSQVQYKMMLRQSERLMELINQLLDLTKLDAGAMPLFTAQHDLCDFLRQTLRAFEPLARQRQISLETDGLEGVAFVEFDRDKMEKIVNNLLSNALKFTPENGSVRLSLIRERQNLRIAVQDTGIGIPTELQDKIFDRFFQISDTQKERIGSGMLGTGIGLALTRELTELMGGRISVESEENQGSVFSIVLPHRDTMPASGRPGVQSVKKSLPVLPETSSKPLLLLVEDNSDMRAHLYEQLSETYEIAQAANGREGLEQARNLVPDIVISDVMMPVMDGFELCSHLKNEDATNHIPVILLTAKAERSDKLEGLLTGADDYLPKPFDIQELMVRTANLVRQRRQLQEKYSQAMYKVVASEIVAESVDERFLQRVREEIEKHIPDEGYSVEDLGHSVGLSRSQLYRKINAMTGVGPLDLIRNLRLERAKQLLQQKAGNVSEVSFMAGFSSPAYFIKCFKERYGMTPGEYYSVTLQEVKSILPAPYSK